MFEPTNTDPAYNTEGRGLSPFETFSTGLMDCLLSGYLAVGSSSIEKHTYEQQEGDINIENTVESEPINLAECVMHSYKVSTKVFEVEVTKGNTTEIERYFMAVKGRFLGNGELFNVTVTLIPEESVLPHLWNFDNMSDACDFLRDFTTKGVALPPEYDFVVKQHKWLNVGDVSAQMGLIYTLEHGKPFNAWLKAENSLHIEYTRDR